MKSSYIKPQPKHIGIENEGKLKKKIFRTDKYWMDSTHNENICSSICQFKTPVIMIALMVIGQTEYN